MDRARYAVDAVLIEGRSIRSVASSIDMSKSWVANQVARYRLGGYEALVPRSTAPHSRPTQLAGKLEDEIVTIRKQLDGEGLDAGPVTIQYHLRRRHGTAPGRSSIHRVLVRRGFVTHQPQKRPRTSWQRFEASLPNETWQADMTHWSIDDGSEEGKKVEIIDFVDDYSRLVIAAVVVPVATAADVVATFYKGASSWGFPASVLTDIQDEFVFRSPLSSAGEARSEVTGARSSPMSSDRSVSRLLAYWSRGEREHHRAGNVLLRTR